MIRHLPHHELFPPWRLWLKAPPVPCLCWSAHSVILCCRCSSPRRSSSLRSVCVCECTDALSGRGVMRWRCQGELSPLSSLLSLSLFALYSQCELFIHRSARVIIVTVSQHGLPHTDTHRHTHTHTHTQMLCIDICIYRMLRGCKQWTCKCFASLRKRFTHQELKFTVAAHSLSLSLSLSVWEILHTQHDKAFSLKPTQTSNYSIYTLHPHNPPDLFSPCLYMTSAKMLCKQHTDVFSPWHPSFLYMSKINKTKQ